MAMSRVARGNKAGRREKRVERGEQGGEKEERDDGSCVLFFSAAEPPLPGDRSTVVGPRRCHAGRTQRENELLTLSRLTRAAQRPTLLVATVAFSPTYLGLPVLLRNLLLPSRIALARLSARVKICSPGIVFSSHASSGIFRYTRSVCVFTFTVHLSSELCFRSAIVSPAHPRNDAISRRAVSFFSSPSSPASLLSPSHSFLLFFFLLPSLLYEGVFPASFRRRAYRASWRITFMGSPEIKRIPRRHGRRKVSRAKLATP